MPAAGWSEADEKSEPRHLRIVEIALSQRIDSARTSENPAPVPLVEDVAHLGVLAALHQRNPGVDHMFLPVREHAVRVPGAQ